MEDRVSPGEREGAPTAPRLRCGQELPPIDGNGGGPDPLEEEFPLGDGDAAESADASCPYCGEWVTLQLDPGSGSRQRYIEDCPVCCRPWTVLVAYQADGSADIELRGEDEG